MVEINEYLWATIYVLKTVYDHNPESPIFHEYASAVIDGDLIYEISENAIQQFFADTREYYNEEDDVATYVFLDPIITQYWKLCDEYEKKLRLDPKDNRFRQDMDQALDSALYINDYSYAYNWYSDTKHEYGCKIVLLCYCEFWSYHWIPKALSEAYDAFVHYTKLIKEAIAELDLPKTDDPSMQTSQRKKAA